MHPRLSLKNITKRYPGIVANDHINMDIAPGEVLAVLGENGAGKSTLMKIIYGSVRPDEGSVEFDGRPLQIDSPAEARELGIAMVHQHFALFDTLTVAENVALGLTEKPSIEEIKDCWKNFSGRAQELNLPSAPKQFLHYFEEADRPQTKLDRMLEGGMAVSIGRLREDIQYDYKFVCLSHNTLRGAAGGAVLLAELLCAEGYITKK